MLKFNYKLFIHILAVCILMNAIAPEFAHAYLDPGTGSMIVQMIIAGIVGIGCTFNVWKNKFLGLFKKDKNGNK